MKFLIAILLTTFTFSLTSAQKIKLVERTVEQTHAQSTETNKANECDTTKFPDFKNNIKEIEIKISNNFKEEIEKIAKTYIDEQCKQDSLHCDSIYLKGRKHYSSTLGYDLFSFAFAFKYSENTIEKESASFFVFGIKQNGKTIFYDIVSDLIGEIQFKLSGLEMKDGMTIIWGEEYPYFSSDEYGKFKLTINKQESNYEFQCKSKDH